MADSNALLDLYGSQQQGDHPLLSLYSSQGQMPQADLGDQPKPKEQNYQVYGGAFHAVPDKTPAPEGQVAKTGKTPQPVDIKGGLEQTKQQATELGAQATGVNALRDIYSGAVPWTAAVGGMVPMALGGPEMGAEEDVLAKGATAVKNMLSPGSTPLGKEASMSLRGALGQAARSTEQTRAELLPYQQQIAVLQPQQRFDLLGYMEGRSKGATLSDTSLQGYANEFRKQMELRKGMIKDAGIEAGVIEDYVTHFWKDPSAARAFINTWSKQGSGKFLKERTLPTIQEGIKAGLQPLTDDPNEIAMRYVTAMDRHIALHQMLSAAESAGHLQYFKKGARDIPDGWVPLGGMADKVGSQAYAPSDWARIWNNFVDRGFARGTDAGDAAAAFRNMSNLTTQTILSFSGYHAVTMAKEAITSDLVKGIGEVAAGLKRAEVMRVLRGAKTMAKAPLSPYTKARLGKKFQQIYLGRTPNDMALLFAEAGGRAVGKEHAFDYKLSAAGSFATAWKRGYLKAEMRQAPDTFSGAFKEAYQKVKQAGGSDTMAVAAARKAYQTAKSIAEIASRVMSTVMAPLFEKYIPLLKDGAFADEMAMWMELNPQAPREQQLDYAAKLIDSIDNRYGEMIQDNIMWSTTAKQVATIGMLSYSWNLGSFRLFAGGAKDLANFTRGALDPTSPNYSPNAAWIIAYPMTVAAISAVLMRLKTGKTPQSAADLVFPQSGGTAPGFGQRGTVPQREITPGYEKEPFGWLYNGVDEATNKANPFLRMGIQALINRDWKGDPIVPPDPTFPEWLKTVSKYWVDSIIPITLGQVFQPEAPGGNISWPEKMMGIRQAPVYAQDPQGYARGMTEINTEKWIKKLKYDLKHNLISQGEYDAAVRAAREKQIKYRGPQQ